MIRSVGNVDTKMCKEDNEGSEEDDSEKRRWMKLVTVLNGDVWYYYLFARVFWLLNLSNTNSHLANAIRVINDSALTSCGGET